MKKTLIILPLVNEKIINSVGRINIEESYFEKPTNRTLNVILYNGILTKVIENIINEGEEKQFEQTMQIK